VTWTALQRTAATPDAIGPARAAPSRPPSSRGVGNQTHLRRLQAKLRVGAVDDPLEREADAVADTVMRMPDPASVGATAEPVLRRKCEACEDEDKTIRRQGADAAVAGGFEAPDVVSEVLAGPGAPLDPATNRYMSLRMGQDFDGVRIHADARADESARAVGAHAYTVGRDVVFADGQYQPGADAGRRLIAHELAHVVQQGSGRHAVRRDTPDKIDVAIVLTDEKQDMVAARAYAPTVIRVYSPEDAAKKLKGMSIRTLYVVSHGSSGGTVQFSDKIGSVSSVKLVDLGQALAGAATVETADFRGCNLGQAPAGLDSFRGAVGAASANATNCYTSQAVSTPLMDKGDEINIESQIPADRKAEFDTALLQQLAAMKSIDGKPVQDCLIGLSKGEKVSRQTLPKIWKKYWEMKGRLVANWANPVETNTWKPGSICMKDLTPNTKPCALIEAKKP